MASHSYLGDDLESIRSRNFLNEGDVYEILIIPLRNIILFPGDILPLRLRSKSYIEAIRSLLRGTSATFHGGLNSLHVGVITLTGEAITAGVVGTTSEIRGYRSNNTNNSNNDSGSGNSNSSSNGNRNNADNNDEDCDEMILTAKGCHRFKVLENAKNVRGVLIARVLILGEDIPRYHRDAASCSPFPSWVTTAIYFYFATLSNSLFFSYLCPLHFSPPRPHYFFSASPPYSLSISFFLPLSFSIAYFPLYSLLFR